MKINKLCYSALARCWVLAAAILMAGEALAQGPVMGIGDEVQINVVGQPDLATNAVISENGSISFPLLGDVTMAGSTTGEAEDRIAQLLSDRGFVRNANVNIFVANRGQSRTRFVTILGEVSRTGRYPLAGELTDGVTTLVDLLAEAGGTSTNAADHVLVVREQGGVTNKTRVDLISLLRDGDLANNVTLAEEDIVFVPSMDVFYVYGEVQRPGRYRLERNMTLMQAISISSGLTPRGTEKGIVINRRDANGKVIGYKAKLSDELQSGDVVYVREGLF